MASISKIKKTIRKRRDDKKLKNRRKETVKKRQKAIKKGLTIDL